MKKMGDGVFNGCTGITTLSIKSGIEAIPADSFKGCTGITEVNIPKSVISIGDNAFSGCSALADVVIPKNTLSIGASAFSGCAFTDVTINKNCSYQSGSFPFTLSDDNYY
jgi:hypothetical protein